MRALTVRQPFAWAIGAGLKPVENRGQNIAGSYRGPVAVHSSLSAASFRYGMDFTPAGEEYARLTAAGERPSLDYGAVIAVVDLIEVHHGWMEAEPCSPWAIRYVGPRGQHHLILANPRQLPNPIPAKGRLGLWTLPADVEAAVLAQIGDPS